MQSPVTREICDKNVKSMTEKIDKVSEKLVSFELKVIKEIANLPNELEKKFDSRYADKTTEKYVEDVTNNMRWMNRLIIGGVIVGLLNLVIR